MRFNPVQMSLTDLLGADYINSVCDAASFLCGADKKQLHEITDTAADFFPEALQDQLIHLLPCIGKANYPALPQTTPGATTHSFQASAMLNQSPLSGLGYYRSGEDGILRFISKSEQYHVPLGHNFPAYKLVDYARKLGIPNATHNNTRGYITRRLEEELVRVAAGIKRGGQAQTSLFSNRSLSRVINLETGSLAAEAALKLVLSRFYQHIDDGCQPKYTGRIPVLMVIGNDDGGLQANYHGTTIITQMMRGLWSGLSKVCEEKGLFLIRCIRPNNIDDVLSLFDQYEKAPYKIAGFFHELIMMNYGGVRLKESFIQNVYTLCEEHDVPTIDDEIQTCVWSPELFLFREYKIQPSMVVIGKGFSGGEYAASRILLNEEMDLLPLFGALVTNGQEELASLCYLITIRWVEANKEIIQTIGEHYEQRLHELAKRYETHIKEIAGQRHLTGIHFHHIDAAKSFTGYLNQAGYDISVHTYKKDCPPSALTKLPLIVGYEAVDQIISTMEKALQRI
jgi:acetylornithine/succinyldiaminopimelate/putrescine aminotransferase